MTSLEMDKNYQFIHTRSFKMNNKISPANECWCCATWGERSDQDNVEIPWRVDDDDEIDWISDQVLGQSQVMIQESSCFDDRKGAGQV